MICALHTHLRTETLHRLVPTPATPAHTAPIQHFGQNTTLHFVSLPLVFFTIPFSNKFGIVISSGLRCYSSRQSLSHHMVPWHTFRSNIPNPIRPSSTSKIAPSYFKAILHNISPFLKIITSWSLIQASFVIILFHLALDSTSPPWLPERVHRYRPAHAIMLLPFIHCSK